MYDLPRQPFEDKQMERSDYAREDIGNLVLLEHVNLTIPDQRLATAFYVSALGLTRDPFLMTGVTNMWINVGRSQIHLPHGDAQRLRGHVGLIVGRRAALIERLRAVRPLLEQTRFGWTERDDRVEVICPWGNRYDCLDSDACAASDPWAGIDLGIAYVQLDVPVGGAASIAAFYREFFDASVEVRERNGSLQAAVAVGRHQQLGNARRKPGIRWTSHSDLCSQFFRTLRATRWAGAELWRGGSPVSLRRTRRSCEWNALLHA
jgi:predicted enzyme related to lactoylglutathione lyase